MPRIGPKRTYEVSGIRYPLARFYPLPALTPTVFTVLFCNTWAPDTGIRVISEMPGMSISIVVHSEL
jgi:hypothetical protein